MKTVKVNVEDIMSEMTVLRCNICGTPVKVMPSNTMPTGNGTATLVCSRCQEKDAAENSCKWQPMSGYFMKAFLRTLQEHDMKLAFTQRRG